MRLGFGLYRYMLHDDYYAFARQCGATDIIVHLCDYGVKNDAAEETVNQPVGDIKGWGVADHPGIWSLEEILRIREELRHHRSARHAASQVHGMEYGVRPDGRRVP